MNKNLKKPITAMCLALALTTAATELPSLSVQNDALIASTYIENTVPLYRYRYETTGGSRTNETRVGGEAEIFTYNNKTSREQEWETTVTNTTSRSANVSSKVPAKAIELSFGGSISQTYTETFKVKGIVPGKKTVHVKQAKYQRSETFNSHIFHEGYAVFDHEWVVLSDKGYGTSTVTTERTEITTSFTSLKK